MEALAPTPERIAKGGILSPVTSQTTKRLTYTSQDAFERLGSRNVLDGEEVLAGKKFTKHHLGSIGVDVRETDEWSGANDLDGIPPTTYHGGKIAEAKAILRPVEFKALVYMAEQGATLTQVGNHVLMIRDKNAAASAALATVQGALYRLIDFWGLRSGNQRHRPPSR